MHTYHWKCTVNVLAVLLSQILKLIREWPMHMANSYFNHWTSPISCQAAHTHTHTHTHTRTTVIVSIPCVQKHYGLLCHPQIIIMKPWQFMWMWFSKNYWNLFLNFSPQPLPLLFHIRQFCKSSLYCKTTYVITTKTSMASLLMK